VTVVRLGAGLVALGLVLASCDGDDSTTRRAGPSTTRASNPRSTDGRQVVTPRPGTVDVRAVPFESATPGPDGRTLVVRFTGGVAPCFVLDRVDVDERADSVTVTLSAGREPAPEPVACIELAVLSETRVRLSAPLADRAVIDGAAA
jgi:hypothetical protein